MYAHVIGHASPAITASRIGGLPLEGSSPLETIQYQLEVAERTARNHEEQAKKG